MVGSLRIFLSLFLFITTQEIIAQPAIKALDQYFSSVKRTGTTPIPQSVLTDKRNERKILHTVQSYFNDPLKEVRSRAYVIACKIGHTSADPSNRQEVVHALVTALRDKDYGVSGIASQSLTNFKIEDFSSIDKDSIVQLIKPNAAHLSVLMKIAGYLNLTQSQSAITQMINSDASAQIKFAGRLALARMGNNDALTYFRDKLAKTPVNDNFVYNVVPELVYTRQKEIFIFLETIIQSNEKLCESPDPDSNRKIECGYRVMEYIAPAIEGFPFTLDASGSLDTNDYEKALNSVREWLKRNPEYKIRKNTF